MPRRIPEHPFAVQFYLIAAFGISWSAYFLRGAAAWPAVVDETLSLTVKFGPSMAGLLASFRFSGFGGVKNLIVRLAVPPPKLTWLALALLLPIGILVAALPFRVLLGGSVAPVSAMTVIETLGLFLTLLATRFFLGGGLGEEFGWRGFMLPALQPRIGAMNASLIIGLAHGAWHIPAYGFGTIFLTLFTVSGAIVFTWMYNRTGGNLLLPALMHASANASLPTIEAVIPSIDQEVLFPLLVFGMWAALALLILWRAGPERLGPEPREQ